jgi:hypothetical protein
VTDLYVIGVDPGPSTGIFVARNGFRFAVFQGEPVPALDSLTALFRTLYEDKERVHVACERYVSSSQPGRTHQPVPQQVIGAMTVLATNLGYPVTMQSPADAKRIAPNELLRHLGFYVMRNEVERPDANDVNDAARHAVLLLMTRYATVLEKRLNAQP